VTKSEHSTEERELVRAMLAGHGTVFSRDGRVGARFDWAGLVQSNKILINTIVRIGSGGTIPALSKWRMWIPFAPARRPGSLPKKNSSQGGADKLTRSRASDTATGAPRSNKSDGSIEPPPPPDDGVAAGGAAAALTMTTVVVLVAAGGAPVHVME
jgi:hypothetical protein